MSYEIRIANLPESDAVAIRGDGKNAPDEARVRPTSCGSEHFVTPEAMGVCAMEEESSDDSFAFLEPWTPVVEHRDRLEQELSTEVVSGHPLYARRVRVIAQRVDCDDILVETDSAEYPYAVVHLVWSGEPERKRRSMARIPAAGPMPTARTKSRAQSEKTGGAGWPAPGGGTRAGVEADADACVEGSGVVVVVVLRSMLSRASSGAGTG